MDILDDGLVRQVRANHPGAQRGVRNRIDQDEAAGDAVLRVGIEEERADGFEFHLGDVVHLQLLTGSCSSVLMLTR